jgi:hypothetical protein
VSDEAITGQLNAEVIPSTVPGGPWFANTLGHVLLRTTPDKKGKSHERGQPLAHH